MQESYIDYAMSVIVGRALPDVRDGLKPVHRRILYAMKEDGITHNAKYRKSASVVGSTLARYHPHGDMAVYHSMVLMAQDFSMRYPLVQGQGNFGCFTKDTEIKLTDGRSISFEEIIKERKEGKKHWTFSFNNNEKKIEIAEVKSPRLIRKKTSLVEVEIDNGKKVKCTPDHRFMLRDGKYKEAQYLKKGDSLMPLYVDIDDGKQDKKMKGYTKIFQPEELEEKARIYNHKVLSVEFLNEKEDVYDITINFWHNFSLGIGVFVHNSVDGDPPSAMRYSEARLSKMGEIMLQDIQKETVDFISNYDGTKKEPTVLPSPVPQLLLNGSLGIAVGMATNIPPHNIGEIVDATVHLIENSKADTEDLFQFVKGPDFPTGGEIYNKEDIISAYSQGRGSITIRGKAEVVEEKGKTQIIITEIPYRVRKAKLVQDFAKLVQKKKLDGIKDIRDESDREGMRIVFDLKSSAYPRKILNRLYSFSSLQEKFHLNMIALIDGIQPRVMGLAELLRYYIDHRNQVIIRRTKFDLQKAKDRAHILEGLYKALSHIDEIIKTIKSSENKENAKQNLMKKFEFTEIQADAILEMKLQKLAKMEKKEIEDELKEKQAIIKKLTAILASDKKIMDIVKKELLEMKEAFNDERRTKVNEKGLKKTDDLDLIPQEPTIVTITQGGYIKRINPATYKAQKRGGKGMLGMKTGKEDVVDHFIEAMTHDFLLFFTDSGKVFRIPVYQIPEGVRTARGRGLLNFLEISPEEKVLAVIPLEKEETVSDKNLIIITKKGIIKKTQLKEFVNIRRSGLIAITLKEGDEVCRVRKTSGSDEIAIATKKGKLIRFNEKEVRAMGRQAGGVRGINIKEKDDGVADVSIIGKESIDGFYLLIMTKNGYGKRIKIKSYHAQKRGGMGVKTVKNTKKIGEVAALRTLTTESDVMMVSRKGKVIRVNLSNIPIQSRITQGARMMRLNKGDKLVSVICI
ncbi:MAG: DNA gyrase subunit A [Patescibacteria group bacterium]|nr:DNA gyrase subunit A [Patescibacteria group bacterium]